MNVLERKKLNSQSLRVFFAKIDKYHINKSFDLTLFSKGHKFERLTVQFHRGKILYRILKRREVKSEF